MSKLSMSFMTILIIAMAIHAQTTITLWHAYRGGEKKALKQVVKKYNSENSEIQIKLLGIPYDAFADKITAAIPRGKGPDIFIFAHDRIGSWEKGEVIEPLDFFIEEDISGQFIDGSYKPMVYEESLYGLPMSVKSIILFYNADMLKEAPKTTDEMIKVAKEFTHPEKGEYGLVYEIANFYFHAGWMQGFGGKVFDENNRPVINSKENIRSFQFAQDMFLKHKIVPPEVSNVLVTSLFNEGKTPMVINGPWFQGEINSKINYEVAQLPIISEIGTPAIPFMSSEGVMMSAKSAHKEEAFKVMQYLVTKEAAETMAIVGKQTVANKEAYQNPLISGDKYLPKFKKQIENSRPMPSIPQMLQVWSPATSAINATVNGKDAKTKLDEAQAQIVKTIKAAGLWK